MKAIKMACVVALGACAVDAEAPEDVTTAVTEQAVTQTDVWHSTWNGGSATASFSSATGSGYLDVYEGQMGQERTAYLQFSTWSVDPTSQQCFTWTDWWGFDYSYCYFTRYTYAYGWGPIPASDAQLTPGNARVSTTLGAGFGGYQCTIDYTNWIFDCGAPTGGTIDVRWNKNNQYSSFSSGTSQQSYGPYTYKQQGTWRSTSASASGTVLGTSFTESYGYFGDTRGTNVTKSVIKTPNP
jgi:hypothetical protein